MSGYTAFTPAILPVQAPMRAVVQCYTSDGARRTQTRR